MSEVRREVPADGDVSIVEMTDAQFASVTRLKDGRPVVFEERKRLVCF
jgi:CRISPR/Cas system-associated protein endoribonuclease Cas2